jgi:hypothetical protein
MFDETCHHISEHSPFVIRRPPKLSELCQSLPHRDNIWLSPEVLKVTQGQIPTSGIDVSKQ